MQGSVSSPPIFHDGVAYVHGGENSVAVRCGGQGDVTDTHVLWSNEKAALDPITDLSQ